MERHPIRDRLTSARERLGQLVLDGMEHLDDNLDVFPADPLQDTQPFDTAELLRRLKLDDESHIIRGEE